MRSMLVGVVAICALLGTTSLVVADSTQLKATRCFFVRDFENWKAPDAKTLYIRINLHRYYRLDLASECHALLWPGSHLITEWRGADSVCSALDWDLKVSQGFPGIPEPCIVKAMTELTPAEAAAIPKRFKP